ncbi:MAG TPA: hypothetical protein DCE73_12625 [Paraprevotella xylaniphila]|nr:hypothetical protein [Paraprevotella xylaniphila]
MQRVGEQHADKKNVFSAKRKIIWLRLNHKFTQQIQKTNRKPSKRLKEPNEKTSQPLYLPSFAGFRFDIMSTSARPERQN